MVFEDWDCWSRSNGGGWVERRLLLLLTLVIEGEVVGESMGEEGRREKSRNWEK